MVLPKSSLQFESRDEYRDRPVLASKEVHRYAQMFSCDHEYADNVTLLNKDPGNCEVSMAQ